MEETKRRVSILRGLMSKRKQRPGLKVDPFLKERETHFCSCRAYLEQRLEDVGNVSCSQSQMSSTVCGLRE